MTQVAEGAGALALDEPLLAGNPLTALLLQYNAAVAPNILDQANFEQRLGVPDNVNMALDHQVIQRVSHIDSDVRIISLHHVVVIPGPGVEFRQDASVGSVLVRLRVHTRTDNDT